MKSLKTLLLLSLVTLFGCTSKPDGVEPVNNFDLEPYLHSEAFPLVQVIVLEYVSSLRGADATVFDVL